MIMAFLSSRRLVVAFFIWSIVPSTHVASALVLEDGYAVTTVLNGHKLGINPRSIHPRPASPDLLVLDSSGSAFYDVSFPTPHGETVIKRLSGDGDGFEDGDLDSARFASPQSFAVDLSGNVYVADKRNHAIRKISKSGVSTIAGGVSNRTGSVDGPAENASFSSDFELVFVPERCALLISDHGNQLVREINLKSEDCARGSQSVMGATSLWILGLGVSCLLGIVIGFALHPYIVAREGSSPISLSEKWKGCLTSLGMQTLMFFFVIRSAAVSLTVYTSLWRLIWLGISYLCFMFNFSRLVFLDCRKEFVSLVHANDLRDRQIGKSHVFDKDLMCFDEDPGALNPVKESVPLVHTDEIGGRKIFGSQMSTDQVKDLICFDEGPEPLNPIKECIDDAGYNQETTNALSQNHGQIDAMIQTSIVGFNEQAVKRILEAESMLGSSGLIRRR